MTSETNYCECGRVRSVGGDLALLWQGYRGEDHIPRENSFMNPTVERAFFLILVSGFHPNSSRTLDPEVIQGFIGVYTY